MQYRQLGQLEDEASIVAFGAWAVGGWKWGGSDEKESIAAIHAAIDAGINLIDTAPVYGMGHSESIVGRAIRDRRHRVLLATKCGLRWEGLPQHQGNYFFTDDQGRDIHRCLHPESIRDEVHQSLRRLGVDSIDLYQTHWPDPKVPIADTMGTLLELKQEGKIRAIGASNVSLAELRAYRDVGPLDADQELFNMLDQGIRGHHLTFLGRERISLLAYSSLALGLLTGRVTADRVFPPGDFRRDSPRFAPEHRRAILRLLEQFQPIANAYSCTIPQLVLAWTFRVPGVTHLLNGIRTPEQALENARAGTIRLDDPDFKTIDRLIREAALNLPSAMVRNQRQTKDES